MATHSYKELLVWQRSMEIVVLVYQLTSQLPKSEEYAIGDQLRRCAVSVPSNIAEGQKRIGAKEFRHFCGIARGSLAELETQLEIINRVYTIDTVKLQNECDQVGKMITNLMKTIKTSNV